MTRKKTMLLKFHDSPQKIEATKKMMVLATKYLRRPMAVDKAPVIGITMISAIKYEVVIQEPSVILKDRAPWISRSDALIT